MTNFWRKGAIGCDQMLPILLMILKIIGIVILAVLVLVFAVLLLVLLAPVRYSVSGSYYGRIQGTVKLTWLLSALWVKATYEDGLDMTVRVLGKRVFQKKEDKSRLRQQVEDSLEDGACQALDLVGKELGVDFVETDEEGWRDSNAGSQDMPAWETAAETGEKEERGETVSQPAGVKAEGRDPKIWQDEALEEEEEFWPQSEEEEPTAEDGAGRGTRKGRKRGKKRCRGDEDMFDGQEDGDDRSKGLGEKAKRAAASAKNAWSRIKEYKEKAWAFWNDESNQKTIRVILRQVKAMIRHVLPRKVRGKVVFGFEDPAVTGKVLSGLSVVYACYGDKVEIVPMFDQKILEAEGSLKGRVKAGVLGARCVRVLLNKNFRRLLWGFLKNGGK